MKLRNYLSFVSVLVLAQPVWAGTAELTQHVQALQQAVNALDARLAKLEGMIQQNQNSLSLLQEMEALKAEVAKMRGQAEVQAHQLEVLGKRQNDLYADLDQRIAGMGKAPTPPVLETASPSSRPAEAGQGALPGVVPETVAPQLDPVVESRTYEAALTHFREANYAGAIAGFKAFLKAYPGSALASNAQYWIGYSYFALKDYKSALAHQQKLVAVYPASAKAPDALLNIASNQIALDDLAGARKTLQALVAQHPGTQAATLAARRLAALK